MGKIVAIGGGEIGRPGYPIQTMPIDKEIIRLSGKSKPNLLFFPTASTDHEGYVQVVHDYFGKKLGCKVDTLYLYDKRESKKVMEQKIMDADIVYVGGGNTLKMMNTWRRAGVDALLKRAYKKGVVMSGLSAGAICWFTCGNSDSRSFKDPNKQWDYIKVSGLDLYPALICPHYDSEIKRVPALKKNLKATSEVGIPIDECAALEIVDDKYRIITSKSGKHVYKAYWQRGKYYLTQVEETTSFKDIKELLSK